MMGRKWFRICTVVKVIMVFAYFFTVHTLTKFFSQYPQTTFSIIKVAWLASGPRETGLLIPPILYIKKKKNNPESYEFQISNSVPVLDFLTASYRNLGLLGLIKRRFLFCGETVQRWAAQSWWWVYRFCWQVSCCPQCSHCCTSGCWGHVAQATTGTQGCTSSPFPFTRKAKVLPGGPNVVLLSSHEADWRLAAGEAESVSPRVEQAEKGRPGDSVWPQCVGRRASGGFSVLFRIMRSRLCRIFKVLPFPVLRTYSKQRF